MQIMFGKGFVSGSISHDIKTGAPVVVEKKLTAKGRKQIKKKNFAIPEKRKYPIHDKSHARNALSRVSQHGSPSEKRRVRAAVHKKYPSLKKSSSKKK
jgi:hypothetical protein